jgi:hypothetical protein
MLLAAVVVQEAVHAAHCLPHASSIHILALYALVYAHIPVSQLALLLPLQHHSIRLIHRHHQRAWTLKENPLFH